MIGDRTRPSKLRNVIVLDIEGQRICILQASVLPTRPLCVLLACSLVSPEVKVKQIVKAVYAARSPHQLWGGRGTHRLCLSGHQWLRLGDSMAVLHPGTTLVFTRLVDLELWMVPNANTDVYPSRRVSNKTFPFNSVEWRGGWWRAGTDKCFL